MGREAQCVCRWGDREGRVTALLESSELIVRGAIRGRAALHTIEAVNARDDVLEFVVAGERIELQLGAAVSRRWADAIAAPPPSLARKLGITATTRLHVAGRIDDAALSAALERAATVDALPGEADLAIIRTDDYVGLIDRIGALTSAVVTPPTWIVYLKGRNAPLGEAVVRESMRQLGFIDTKVAAVSDRLTALKCVKRAEIA
jgi:hypothetical protein